KMERAVFTTEVTGGEPGPEGRDIVTFAVATNPGAPAGPLNRIASGGELSRFLLALKVCLTGQAPGLTLIFDEIDRGVGGATADAVGRRLKALAQTAQVLVVTHSPQVAALGAHHWRVEKRVAGDVTTSTVTALDPAARVEEIARMLAGDTITDAARQAARALLDG
ncbi:MAG TPA: DNA repair protein RecN, partial [Paracoccaceae bacterium]|nr:DNA repair protein RecN [Paracoccaceae bacterium]